MRHRLLTACRPSTSDAQLARRAAAGDDDAFEKLYARYQPRLEAYCRSIVRHDEDARDAVQNAMTKALVALRRETDTTNVQGWLFRIAHNESISLLRRRRPTSELNEVLHDGALGPAGDLLLREELRATLDNVRALPGNLQHPLLLRELAGLSYAQVAEVVGGTPAAARKAVFDARTALSADRAGRDEACAVIRQSLSEGDGRRRRARIVRSHLQSCNACCAWESEQRLRRHHLSALLPAAGSASGVFAGLLGLLGGGSTVAGVSGGLATNAKVAASLAVIAAGATPVVAKVERAAPVREASASASPGASASTSASASAGRGGVRPDTTASAPPAATAAAARGAARAAAIAAATAERRLAARRAVARAEGAGADGAPTAPGRLGADGAPMASGRLGADGAPMASGRLGADGAPMASGRPGASRDDRLAPTRERAAVDGRDRVSGANVLAPRPRATLDDADRRALEAFAAGAMPRRSRTQPDGSARSPADATVRQPSADAPALADGTTLQRPGDAPDGFEGAG